MSTVSFISLSSRGKISRNFGFPGSLVFVLFSRSYLLLLTTAVSIFLIANPVEALDKIHPGDDDQMLYEQINALQIQLDQLKQKVNSSDQVENQNIEQTAWYADSRPNCPPAESYGFPIPMENKYPTVRLTGFFQADAGWYYQDEASKAAVGDIQDGADFRRTRLAGTGKVWENVSYMLEMDFAFPGRPSFMDVWLEIEEVGGGNLRVGQFITPFGMDGLTSARELTFLERAVPFTFLLFRQIGMMYHGTSEDDSVTWSIAGFRYPTGPWGSSIGDSGYGMSARFTGLLYDEGEDGAVHLGGGFVFADPAENLLRYRNLPEFSILLAPALVDTGFMDVNHFFNMNAELATTCGPFHAQSEIFFAFTDQMDGTQTVFPGAYAQVAWILTGEHRPYKYKSGVLGRVIPDHPFGKCGIGAWEIAGRWSYLDLNDENILGGRVNDLSLGMNWYLNKNTKFQFNYIHSFLDSSSNINGPVIKNSNSDIIAMRAQLDF